MNRLSEMIKAEPVLFQGVIQAGLIMLLSFGFNMSADQMAGILLFTASVLTFWTRKQVTSNPNVEKRIAEAVPDVAVLVIKEAAGNKQ